MAPKRSQIPDYKTTPDEKDSEAMMLIANWARLGTEKSFPSKLKKYLKENKYLVEAPTAAGHVLPFEVYFINEQIRVRQLAAGTPMQGFPLRFDAHFVEMIGRSATTGQAIQIFEPGNFITIDLANQTPRVVLTVQLQACSFVIGHDDNNRNLLHLGHAQPAGAEVVNPSAVLADHFKNAGPNSVFRGRQLKKKWVIGGLGMDVIIKLFGWVSGGKLFLAIKTGNDLNVKEYPSTSFFS